MNHENRVLSLSRWEGVKKLEFAPSPYPLPVGERVNLLK
jgi:hypothetical protein